MKSMMNFNVPCCLFSLLLISGVMAKAAEQRVAVSSVDPQKVHETYLNADQLRKAGSFTSKFKLDSESIERKCRESIERQGKYPISIQDWKMGAIVVSRYEEGDVCSVHFYKSPKLAEFSKDEGPMSPPNSSGTWVLILLADGAILHPKI